MELRQLKYFVTVAETRSFSTAAKRLYVSQSALSQQIKLLEEELTVKLFTRGSRNVTLTESGTELLPLANNILQNIVACRERINSLKQLMHGELNIGVAFTLEPCIRETMLGFMKKHPDIRVNAFYKNASELLHDLRTNKIDMMFSFMPTEPHNFIESVPLVSHRLIAAMRRSHPLASKPFITLDDLKHQRIIMPDTGLNEHDTIGYYLQAEIKGVHICSHVNNAYAILNMLQESNCISVLTHSTILSNPNICGVPIEKVDKPICSYVHFNRHAPRKHCANAFIEEFRNSNAFYIIQHT